jgi:hypothetical protein
MGHNPEFGGIDAQFDHQNIPLYKVEAEIRESMVSNIKYELFLVLGNEQTFSGKVNIHFKFTQITGDKELFVDFQGK